MQYCISDGGPSNPFWRPATLMKKYLGGLRIAAFLLDSLLITVGVLLSGFFLSSLVLRFFPTELIPVRVFWGIMVLLGMGYFLLRDGFGGRSAGKRIMGLHVMTLDGRPCSWWNSVKRNCTVFIPLFNLVELVLFLKDPHKPRLGDRLTKTHVEET